jgi:diguanylate cyclase (GGDEF)-like protein
LAGPPTVPASTRFSSPRHRSKPDRLIGQLAAVVYGLVLAGYLLGLFLPADLALRDSRFGFQSRGVSGDVVFVDIDSASLNKVGVWPWPRQTHAELLDRLVDLGAGDIVFDIDFSQASTETGDAAFEAALRRAGGYAHLAAFQQQRDGAGVAGFNLPLPRFRALADPVAVNVGLDDGGVVRHYPFALSIGGMAVGSVASLLSGVHSPVGTGFDIDFSINPAAIARVSAADLLAGKVPRDRIADKQVIIGASAVELRDLFVVPRFGILPGALLQAVAAETLKQGRALEPVSRLPVALIVVLLGLLAVFGIRRLAPPLAIAVALLVSAITEAAALVLHLRFALLADTAAVHVAALSLIVAVLVWELVTRGLQRAQATRERDGVRLVLDQVITDNFDGVVVATADRRVISASVPAVAMLGESLVGRPIDTLPQAFAALLSDCLSSGGGAGELAFTHRSGARLIEYVLTRSEVPLAEGPSAVACLTFRDVTERRAAEERLRFMVGHDSITGAMRRTRLTDLINAAFAENRDVGVIVLDLRRFRFINDALGHGQGDLLLRQVASRLQGMGPDAVARLGGDTFAMLVPALPPEQLLGYCAGVTQGLAAPYELAGDHQAIIAASAGATTSTASGRDAEMLLSHADMALSAAKQSTGSSVRLFSPEMDDRLRDSRDMDAALRRALAEQQFTLEYQPQTLLANGEMVGVEALIRWTHPTLGTVSPATFVPAAEETGIVVGLGRWALEQACREAAQWPGEIHVAVNVSPVQFELSDVVADVRAALDKSGLPPDRLEIEITEGIFVRDFEAVVRRLGELRGLGIGIALDDFGTGYSSLSYLSQLPIDKIKIDQSFVKKLPADREAAAIIQAVVTLSQMLGKRVIAEGVETAQQAAALARMGCTLAQGYHFGRPMSSAGVAGLVAGQSLASDTARLFALVE